MLKGEIPYERLDRSVERIDKYKKHLLYPRRKISLKGVEEYFFKE
jgi:hypothetical protein